MQTIYEHDVFRVIHVSGAYVVQGKVVTYEWEDIQRFSHDESIAQTNAASKASQAVARWYVMTYPDGEPWNPPA